MGHIFNTVFSNKTIGAIWAVCCERVYLNKSNILLLDQFLPLWIQAGAQTLCLNYIPPYFSKIQLSAGQFLANQSCFFSFSFSFPFPFPFSNPTKLCFFELLKATVSGRSYL